MPILKPVWRGRPHRSPGIAAQSVANDCSKTPPQSLVNRAEALLNELGDFDHCNVWVRSVGMHIETLGVC
ncbi:hypothetical protein RBWH47_02540 [Rhodopirellula baltica WH47]|uniref:Uncharacterized protein n=1 Tax=Rhodopirellula baltica WH47 TaxID=991778 RepID=F2AMQ8_RHOBT|nr:hypothetical protein RBWH47_02540 [Rhodopirellula baltica WH47]